MMLYLLKFIIILINVLLIKSMILLKSINDIITIKGKDNIRLLQALTTSDFDLISTTSLCTRNSIVIPTSFVNVKGHLLYTCNCIITYNNDNEYEAKVYIDNNQGDSLRSYFEKYIFPLDKVNVNNEKQQVTLVTALYNNDNSQKFLNIFDDNVKKVFKKVTGDDLSIMKQENEWKGYQNVAVYSNDDNNSPNLYAWKGNPFVGIDNKEPEEVKASIMKEYNSGFTFVGEGENADKVTSLLKLQLGESISVPSDNNKVWNSLRIAAGVPSSLHEIGSPMNASALELGMMHTVSFGKGCYTGQESLVHAYSASGPLVNGIRLNGVRRRLVGLKVKDSASISNIIPRSNIVDETNEVVGIVTTSLIEPCGIEAIDELAVGKVLGLVKSSIASNQNLFINSINDAEKIPVTLEYLSYPRYDAMKSSSSPPVIKLANKGKQIEEVPKATGITDEAALAKAKKLAEMAAKVARLQAKAKKE